MKLIYRYRMWHGMGFRRKDALYLAIKYLNL